MESLRGQCPGRIRFQSSDFVMDAWHASACRAIGPRRLRGGGGASGPPLPRYRRACSYRVVSCTHLGYPVCHRFFTRFRLPRGALQRADCHPLDDRRFTSISQPPLVLTPQLFSVHLISTAVDHPKASSVAIRSFPQFDHRRPDATSGSGPQYPGAPPRHQRQPKRPADPSDCRRGRADPPDPHALDLHLPNYTDRSNSPESVHALLPHFCHSGASTMSSPYPISSPHEWGLDEASLAWAGWGQV